MTEDRPLAMAAGLKEFVLTTADGEFSRAVPMHEVFRTVKNAPVLVCNRSLMKGRLGGRMPATVLDVLELFAFVCPAQNVVPTAKEIAAFLNITKPTNAFEEARCLFSITRILLSKLAALDAEESQQAVDLAITMNRDGGWIWGADVLAALGRDPNTVGITVQPFPVPPEAGR